jgi:hypothetical protein
MSEFLRSNPKLDEVIRNATTVAEMREAMLSELAAQGTVVRDRQDQYDIRVLPQSPEPPPPDVSLPAENRMRKASETFFRYITYDNSHIELVGNSEQDLDRRESEIRAILSRRK